MPPTPIKGKKKSDQPAVTGSDIFKKVAEPFAPRLVKDDAPEQEAEKKKDGLSTTPLSPSTDMQEAGQSIATTDPQESSDQPAPQLTPVNKPDSTIPAQPHDTFNLIPNEWEHPEDKKPVLGKSFKDIFAAKNFLQHDLAVQQAFTLANSNQYGPTNSLTSSLPVKSNLNGNLIPTHQEILDHEKHEIATNPTAIAQYKAKRVAVLDKEAEEPLNNIKGMMTARGYHAQGLDKAQDAEESKLSSIVKYKKDLSDSIDDHYATVLGGLRPVERSVLGTDGKTRVEKTYEPLDGTLDEKDISGTLVRDMGMDLLSVTNPAMAAKVGHGDTPSIDQQAKFMGLYARSKYLEGQLAEKINTKELSDAFARYSDNKATPQDVDALDKAGVKSAYDEFKSLDKKSDDVTHDYPEIRKNFLKKAIFNELNNRHGASNGFLGMQGWDEKQVGAVVNDYKKKLTDPRDIAILDGIVEDKELGYLNGDNQSWAMKMAEQFSNVLYKSGEFVTKDLVKSIIPNAIGDVLNVGDKKARTRAKNLAAEQAVSEGDAQSYTVNSNFKPDQKTFFSKQYVESDPNAKDENGNSTFLKTVKNTGQNDGSFINKVIYNSASQFGQLAGQVAIAAALPEFGAQGFNLAESSAPMQFIENKASTFLSKVAVPAYAMSYDDNYRQSFDDIGVKEPWKNSLYAGLLSAYEGATEMMGNPLTQAKFLHSAFGTSVKDLVKNLTVDELQKMGREGLQAKLKTSVMEGLKGLGHGVAESAGEANEEYVNSILGGVTKMVMSPGSTTPSNIMADAQQTWLETFAGMGFMPAAGVLKGARTGLGSKLSQSAVVMLAQNAEQAKENILKLKSEGKFNDDEANEKIRLVNTAQKAYADSRLALAVTGNKSDKQGRALTMARANELEIQGQINEAKKSDNPALVEVLENKKANYTEIGKAILGKEIQFDDVTGYPAVQPIASTDKTNNKLPDDQKQQLDTWLEQQNADLRKSFSDKPFKDFKADYQKVEQEYQKKLGDIKREAPEAPATAPVYKLDGKVVSRDEADKAITTTNDVKIDISGDPELEKKLKDQGRNVTTSESSSQPEEEKDPEQAAKDLIAQALAAENPTENQKPKANTETVEEPAAEYDATLPVKEKVAYIEKNTFLYRKGFKNDEEYVGYFEDGRKKINDILDKGGSAQDVLKGEGYVDSYFERHKDDGEIQKEYEKLLTRFGLPLNRQSADENKKAKETKETAEAAKQPAATSTDTNRPANEEIKPEAGANNETNAKAPVSFTTAKGSTYQFHDDGTTTRDKKYRPEHGKDEQGPQPRSEKTFFITKEQSDKLSLVQATSPDDNQRFIIGQAPNGDIGVGVVGGKGDGMFAKGTKITPSLTPAVGLMPLEIWKGGREHHFGNEITAISSSKNSNNEKTKSENPDSSSNTQQRVNPSQEQEQNNEENEQGKGNEQGEKHVKPAEGTSTNESAGTSSAFELFENEGEWKVKTSIYKGRAVANFVHWFLDKNQKKEYDKLRAASDGVFGTKEQAEVKLKAIQEFERNNTEAFTKAKESVDTITSTNESAGTSSNDMPVTEAEKMQFGSGYKDFDFNRKNIPIAKVKITEMPSLSEKKGLVDDIKLSGVKIPIVVEHDVESDTYYVKNGNHRVAAAKEAGLTDIPAIVATFRDDANNSIQETPATKKTGKKSQLQQLQDFLSIPHEKTGKEIPLYEKYDVAAVHAMPLYQALNEKQKQLVNETLAALNHNNDTKKDIHDPLWMQYSVTAAVTLAEYLEGTYPNGKSLNRATLENDLKDLNEWLTEYKVGDNSLRAAHEKHKHFITNKRFEATREALRNFKKTEDYDKFESDLLDALDTNMSLPSDVRMVKHYAHNILYELLPGTQRKVGETYGLMDESTTLTHTQTDEGVNYELYSTKDKGGIYRVYDADNKSIITLRKYKKLSQAKQAYDDAMSVIREAGSPGENYLSSADKNGKTTIINGYNFTSTPSFTEAGGLIVKPLSPDVATVIGKSFKDAEKAKTVGVSDAGNGWTKIVGDNGQITMYAPSTNEVVGIDHTKGGRTEIAVDDFVYNNPRETVPATQDNTPIKKGDVVTYKGADATVTKIFTAPKGTNLEGQRLVNLNKADGKKAINIPVSSLTSKTTENAVQEQSTTEVHVRNQSTDGEQVRSGNEIVQEATGEGKTQSGTQKSGEETKVDVLGKDAVTGKPLVISLGRNKVINKFVGVNAEGNAVYEDENGVRSVDAGNGIYSTEPISLVPVAINEGGSGKSYYSYEYRTGTRSSDYLTAAEQSILNEAAADLTPSEKRSLDENGISPADILAAADENLDIAPSSIKTLLEAGKENGTVFVLPINNNITTNESSEGTKGDQRNTGDQQQQHGTGSESTNDQKPATESSTGDKETNQPNKAVKPKVGDIVRVLGSKEDLIVAAINGKWKTFFPTYTDGRAYEEMSLPLDRITGIVNSPLQQKTELEKIDDEIRAARAKFKASVKRSMGNLSMNPTDLEFMADGLSLIAAYAKKGIYKLTDLVRELINDGDAELVTDKDYQRALRIVYAANLSTLTRETRMKYDSLDQMENFFDNDLPVMIAVAEATATDENTPASFKPLDEQFEKAVEPHIAFKDIVKKNIEVGLKQNIVYLRAQARDLGMGEVSDIELQELAELAVVELAREVALSDKNFDQKLGAISNVYDNQPSLNQRSSTRVELQQYSTPAPITYIAGDYINGIAPETVFEPSAGNGLLTIAFPTNIVSVNEIDETRLRSLGTQNFKSVSNQDARLPFTALQRTQDGVLTNPPFGAAENKVYDGYNIRGLAPQMAINALETMKDDGRAAIVIGGHNSYGDDGRLQKDRFFMNYLYSHYNVADIIDINGDLYRKQGTSFDIRLILIDGRKAEPKGIAPTRDQHNTKRVDSFKELADRVKALPAAPRNNQVALSYPDATGVFVNATAMEKLGDLFAGFGMGRAGANLSFISYLTQNRAQSAAREYEQDNVDANGQKTGNRNTYKHLTKEQVNALYKEAVKSIGSDLKEIKKEDSGDRGNSLHFDLEKLQYFFKVVDTPVTRAIKEALAPVWFEIDREGQRSWDHFMENRDKKDTPEFRKENDQIKEDAGKNISEIGKNLNITNLSKIKDLYGDASKIKFTPNETTSKPEVDGRRDNGNVIPGTSQQSEPNKRTGDRTVADTNSGNSENESGTRGEPGRNDIRNVRGQSSASESNTDGSSALSTADGQLSDDDQQVSTGTRSEGTADTGRSTADIQRNEPLQSPRQFTSSELAKEKIPYEPVSKNAPVGTVIPTQMASEAQRVLRKIDDEEGGIDNYVKNRLKYPSTEDVYKAFSAEQVDAIAMSIAQIEEGNGMIIGDMTGVGKGRIAAAIIRYGVLNGYKPLFLTEKTTLFSDMYRDLLDINSGGFEPFIINNPDPGRNPNIYDKDGNLVFKAMSAKAKDLWFKRGELPPGSQYMVASYSQFNSNPSKPSAKRDFLRAIAQNNIFVMDESHNAGGDGNTGVLFQEVLEGLKGAIYLSATFAKTPKNMPVYSVKTAMREANMSKEELVNAIEKGGVALQEVVSSQLVESGQMLRRERNFDGVSIDYEMLEPLKEQHRAIADKVTDIIRNVIKFQGEHISPAIEQMDNAAKGDDEGHNVGTTQGTSEAGVSNTPFASRVFNVIDQFLFSIKAEAAADAAIEELKAGRKPVLKFKSTMESFLKNEGFNVGDELKKPDFSLALKRALDTVMRYTVTDAGGNNTTMQLDPSALTKEGQEAYYEILDKVKKVSTGISISPIDLMIKKIEDAGYTVAEITGRKMVLKYNNDGSAVVAQRENADTRTNVKNFNSGKLDVLMFNASGATGISMHASSTFPDKRQRVMISPQLELDINKEIQGRGRIDRTGQVVRGAYRYIVSSIPAELRLLMMFQAKVKSLDANTTSSQKSKATKVSLTDDFLNKYGDEIIFEYLKEHPEVNEKMLDPLKMLELSEDQLGEMTAPEDAARIVTGKVAILDSAEQEKFYSEVAERYKDLMDYKESINENDLEVKVMPLEAKTLSRTVAIVGKGGVSPFGADSILEKVEANILRKPYTKEELDKQISDALDGRNAKAIAATMVNEMQQYMANKVEEEKEGIENYIKGKVAEAYSTIKGKTEQERKAKLKAKLEILEQSRVAKINIMENKLEGLRSIAQRRLSFFTIGRPLLIPTNSNVAAGVVSHSKGIFLGFEIKDKAKNRYAPSNIKLRFAVEDSRRNIVVPSSQNGFINEIVAGSFMNFSGMDSMIDNWGKGKASANRGIQYIVTGNVLQAFGNYKGQLVSFSTDKGELRKGILLNEAEVAKIGDNGVRVPINKALGFVQDQLASGYRVQSIDGEVTFGTDRRDRLTIEVPKSKKNGAKYYLNEKLRNLVDHKEFNTVGGEMTATYHPSDLQSILDVFTNEFGTNLELSREQAGIKEEKVDDDEAPLQSADDYVRDNLPGTLDDVPVQADETVSAVLQRLSKGNGPVAEIARQINPDQRSLNVRFEVRDTPDGRSYYDPISDTIVLTPAHAQDDVIALHEINHAATAKKIPAGLNTIEKITAYINDPVSDPDVVLLAKVFVQSLQKTRPGAYGLTNLDEFVSEAFSNKNFRSELAAAKYRETKQSLWQKLMSAIKGLLGVKSDTLLDKAMEAGFRIMENAKRGEERTGQVKSSDALINALKNFAFLRLHKVVPFADFVDEVQKTFNYGSTPEQKRVIRLAYEAARAMHSKLNEATTPEQRQAVIDAEGFEPLKKNVRGRVDKMTPPSPDGNQSSVKNRVAEANREKLGVPGAIPAPEHRADEQVRKEADAIEKDYNIRGLINTVLDKVRSATDVELELLGRYIAGKEAEVARLNDEMMSTVDADGDIGDVRDRRDQSLTDLNDAYNAARMTGTDTARALAYRRTTRLQDESLAAMFSDESKSAGTSTFTDEQKDQVIREFNEIKAAKEAYEKRIADLEKELSEKNAAAAVRAEEEAAAAKKKKANKAPKKEAKSKSDFTKEREDIIAKMKQDLKDLRSGKKGLMALPIPYAAQLITIAPSVAKLTASLIEEGVTALADVVDNIKTFIQDEIPQITDRDVHDLIAGVYNDDKKTRSELQQQLFEIRREARLTTELEDLMAGEPPKDPKKRVKNNARIEALQKQITDYKKKYREAELATAKGQAAALAEMKDRLKKSVADIEAKIAAGNYKAEPKKSNIELDQEAKDLQNRLIDLRRERVKRLAQQEYDRRSAWYKSGRVAEEVIGLPRTMMSSFDFSAVLRQGVVATVAHPILAVSAGIEMFQQTFSQRRFDRWLDNLKNANDYEDMKKAGLFIADPDAFELSQHEEVFRAKMIEKVPIYGTWFIKGSERAYVSYLNKLRVDVYRQGAASLAATGRTFNNDPATFKKLASFVNNSTGRGELGRAENAAGFLSAFLFSPRLIASRLNLLNPVYYAKLPWAVKKMALADMATFVGFGTSVLALAKFGLPCSVSGEATSADFGKIKCGQTRYDIWGGFQPYIRVFSQFLFGKRTSSTTGDQRKVNRGDLVSRFVRGKLAPVPATIVDFAQGTKITGEPVTVKGKAIELFSPLTAQDIYSAINEAGTTPVKVAGTAAFNAFGGTVQTYQ